MNTASPNCLIPRLIYEAAFYFLARALSRYHRCGWRNRNSFATPAPRFEISGWIDSGITFNPASPQDNQNFGRFFDDRANEPLLNQLVVNFERALAPQPGEFDWGFKLQFMYGSDARYIHSLGLFGDTAATSILQPDLVEDISTFTFPLSARAAST